MMLVCFESILVLTVPFKIRFYFLECDDDLELRMKTRGAVLYPKPLLPFKNDDV